MMYFFDLDGTLIDSNGVWKQVDRDFLAKRNMPYTHEYYEGVAHTALPMAAVFTKEYCKLEESCEEIIAEWMEMSRDMYAKVPLKPGVREYLEQCRANGIPMALVTSSVPEHCFTALKKQGLEDYFANVCSGRISIDFWYYPQDSVEARPGATEYTMAAPEPTASVPRDYGDGRQTYTFSVTPTVGSRSYEWLEEHGVTLHTVGDEYELTAGYASYGRYN